ncbi:nucleotidyltransferase domain-containing protein, partial [Dehalococcoidia bacterium]|nr:nucleotidyltransferase domain-containing protein [Dehalococcoidia bacterium]
IDDFIRGGEALERFDDIIVFGSAGDGTFIPGWSDYDVLVVLKNDGILAQAEEIKKINEWLSHSNHHGVDVVFHQMFARWCQNWLPLHVLSSGYGYAGKTYECAYYNDPVEYRTRLQYWAQYFDAAVATGTLSHHSRDGHYLTDNPSDISNRAYQFKYFLSVVFLLPCLFFNSKGFFYTKGVCLREIRNEDTLSPETLDFLDECSSIRKCWLEDDGRLKTQLDANFVPSMFRNALRMTRELIEGL